MNKLYTILAVLAAIFTALPKAIKACAPAFSGKQPDITPAMILATVKFVVTQALALALLKPGQSQTILMVAGTFIPAAYVFADVLLRSARNKAELAKVLLPYES